VKPPIAASGLVIDLNMQPDHVHLLVWLPPKSSMAEIVGTDGNGWQNCGTMSQDIAGEESEFGQTGTGLIGENELTRPAPHLCGG
jgi:hypothetical protein